MEQSSICFLKRSRYTGDCIWNQIVKTFDADIVVIYQEK